jgi:toxin HigB-1
MALCYDMIRTFGCKETEKVFAGTFSRKLPQTIQKRAHMRLKDINRIITVEELAVLPGNHLEKLGGDLSGYWSIRINAQFRIIFLWDGQNADTVQIVDYH